MKAEHIGLALHAVGLKHSTSRLLTHMAWRCDESGVFYESRTTTCHALGMHEDMVKRGLRELLDLGYISEALEARAGRNTRHLALHPDRWTQPEPLPDRWPAPGPPTPPEDPEPEISTGPEWARAELRRALRA